MIPELLKEFLIESYEGLDQLDRDFVDLEKDPQNRVTLDSVFRTIHTIKGTCGLLAFHKLESVSHMAESLLSRMRDGEIVLDAAIATALLRTVDVIREILASVEATETEGDGDYTAIVAELQVLSERAGRPVFHGSRPAASVAEEPAASVAPAPAAVAAEASDPDDAPRAESREAAGDGRGGVSDSSLRVDVGLIDKLMTLVG